MCYFITLVIWGLNSSHIWTKCHLSTRNGQLEKFTHLHVSLYLRLHHELYRRTWLEHSNIDMSPHIARSYIGICSNIDAVLYTIRHIYTLIWGHISNMTFGHFGQLVSTLVTFVFCTFVSFWLLYRKLLLQVVRSTHLHRVI
jgi:hypothetical protein